MKKFTIEYREIKEGSNWKPYKRYKKERSRDKALVDLQKQDESQGNEFQYKVGKNLEGIEGI